MTPLQRHDINPYQVLGIPGNATAEDIRAAYRALVKKYHPDLNKSPDAAQKTALINQAYTLLTNPPTDHVSYRSGHTDHFYEMEEDSAEGYRREHQSSQVRQANERMVVRKRREAGVYQFARIISLPLATFSLLIILDFFLPTRVEHHVPLYGFQKVDHGDSFSVSSFMKTSGYVIEVPDEMHENYNYVAARKKAIRLEFTPIFRTLRWIGVVQEHYSYSAPNTAYSTIFFPFPYIIFFLSLWFISKKEYNVERYTFCLIPLCLTMALFVKIFSPS